MKNLDNSGVILSASECSELELEDAKRTNRYYEDGTGTGYVWLTPECLRERDKQHIELKLKLLDISTAPEGVYFRFKDNFDDIIKIIE